MKIIVVGAGPSGSSAAYHLCQDGHEVLILDPLGAHEKICGGGVPEKALKQFPYFYEDFPAAKVAHADVQFSFEGSDWCQVTMPGGMGIFSRKEHDGHILQKALDAGAQIAHERFKNCDYSDGIWTIETDKESHQADYLVGADGAVSRVRNLLAKKLPREAYFKAYDYLLPKIDRPVHIGFHKELNGYLWFFPRENSSSVGIGDLSDNQSRRRELLDAYMQQLGLKQEDILERRSALIPSMRPQELEAHQVAGEHWALVGDAAALAEPVTGEGIYYAVYSGEFLARCLREERSYQSDFRKEFASMLGEVKHSRRVYAAVNTSLVKYLLKRSSTMRQLTGLCMAAVKSPHYYRWQFILKSPLILFQAVLKPS